MDFFFKPLDLPFLQKFETFLSDWVFVIALVFLGAELVRYALVKRLNWTLVADSVTNFITFGFYTLISLFLLGTFYLAAFSSAAQWAFFEIPSNLATLVVCIVLADLTYYLEHRFTHRVNLAWATHTVHHSSPNYNLSVAYRFGPMDAIWAVLFHIPLVLAGFDPVMVLFAEVIVLEYQTFLHTEAVGKLPRPIEWLMNTPSHHRVHHGSNKAYLDKNYGGIFIIWDRLFGTFAQEEETVEYGLVKPINSVNPFVAFFHGLYRLGRDVWKMPGFTNKLGVLINPPGWHPKPPEQEHK